METLKIADKMYQYLSSLPIVGKYFADNAPIIIGFLGIWCFWLLIARVTRIHTLIRRVNEDANGDLQESDLILLLPLNWRLMLYKIIIPIQSLAVLMLGVLVMVVGGGFMEKLFLESSTDKFSKLANSFLFLLFIGWIWNLQRLYLFQLARFIRCNRDNT